jgi:predicted small secreted protein
MASKSKCEMFKHNWCLKRYKVQITCKVNVDVLFSSFSFQKQIKGKWIKINKECYSMIYYKNK